MQHDVVLISLSVVGLVAWVLLKTKTMDVLFMMAQMRPIAFPSTLPRSLFVFLSCSLVEFQPCWLSSNHLFATLFAAFLSCHAPGIVFAALFFCMRRARPGAFFAPRAFVRASSPLASGAPPLRFFLFLFCFVCTGEHNPYSPFSLTIRCTLRVFHLSLLFGLSRSRARLARRCELPELLRACTLCVFRCAQCIVNERYVACRLSFMPCI